MFVPQRYCAASRIFPFFHSIDSGAVHWKKKNKEEEEENLVATQGHSVYRSRTNKCQCSICSVVCARTLQKKTWIHKIKLKKKSVQESRQLKHNGRQYFNIIFLFVLLWFVAMANWWLRLTKRNNCVKTPHTMDNVIENWLFVVKLLMRVLKCRANRT